MTSLNNFGNLAFLDISPLEYYSQLTNLNALVQKSLAKKLQARFGNIPEVATIIIPGSDGRLEAGSPLSKFELITVLRSDSSDNESLLMELKAATADVGLLGPTHTPNPQ